MSRRFQLDSAIVADIQTVNADSYIDSLKMIDIDLIEPNKNNFYEMSEIEALADDIERQGLMTALVVSEQNGGKQKKRQSPLFHQGRKAEYRNGA